MNLEYEEMVVVVEGVSKKHTHTPPTTHQRKTNHYNNRCDGTWGLVVLSPKEPDELVVACNGSPMVLGIGEGRYVKEGREG